MSSNTKRYPDFLIIGAGKSGTTSLDNYLKQHPNIFINDHKEPNYFGYMTYGDSDFARDRQILGTPFENYVLRQEDYLDLFADASAGQKIGETSNSYLYLEQAPQNIFNTTPFVNLIAILRQPAERLYSRYLHLAREGRHPGEKFEDCLNRGTEWWVRNDLIKEGYYYKNLRRYYQLFDASKIKVILYEDLRSDPQGVLRDLFTFLDVDPHFQPDTSIQFNKSGYIKNEAVDSIVGNRGILVKAGRKVLPSALYTKIKNTKIVQSTVNKLRNKNLERPKLSSEFKMKLTKEVYEEDISQLEHLIDRDLSHWR